VFNCADFACCLRAIREVQPDSKTSYPRYVRNRLEELLPEPLSSVLAREEAQRKTLEAAIKAAIANQ
jgi:hypothetical protein